MSIPGKVLIALLSALAVSVVSGFINEQLSLAVLFGPTAVASILAVVLSHRALPMPSGLSADNQAGTGPATAKEAPRTEKAASRKKGTGRGNSEQKAKRNSERTRKSEQPTATATASKAPPGKLENGTVKWFNASKGFGFIVRENGEEIFVHHRSIQGEGRRSLRDGAAVSFHVVTTDKGPQAEDVTPIA